MNATFAYELSCRKAVQSAERTVDAATYYEPGEEGAEVAIAAAAEAEAALPGLRAALAAAEQESDAVCTADSHAVILAHRDARAVRDTTAHGTPEYTAATAALAGLEAPIRRMDARQRAEQLRASRKQNRAWDRHDS